MSQPAANDSDKLPLWVALQIGLLFTGQGLLSLLLLGVMNRVMLDEHLLAIPATVATTCVSLRFFVAVARVYLGQLTDSRTFLGQQRTGYIRVALPLACLFLWLSLQVTWQVGATGAWKWAVLLGLTLALYGLCLFMVAVAGLALVHDIAPRNDRSRVMGIVWAMMLIGFVFGSLAGKKLLEGVDIGNLQPSIDRYFLQMIGAVLVLGYFGTWGVERRFSLLSRRADGQASQHVGFVQAVRLFLTDRKNTQFFVFLFLVTLGVFMQQPILEPYGGEVFAMSLGDTTLLNMIWGIATLIALVATGFTLAPRLGPWTTTRIGLFICACGFLGIFAAGLLGEGGVYYFQAAVFVMGVGGGIALNSMLSLMLGLAPSAHAGLYMGTFGLSQYIAQGISLVASGFLLDTGRDAFANASWAYGTVFLLEAAILFGCVLLLRIIERNSPTLDGPGASVSEMIEASD